VPPDDLLVVLAFADVGAARVALRDVIELEAVIGAV
jgi:hypothetical protein